MACISVGTWFCSTRTPSISNSLSISSGSRTPRNLKMAATTRSGLLRCSFLRSSISLSSPSSFSGVSLGLDFNTGTRTEKSRGLVVRAGKAALCQTKRSRSRKSLARTHGFRKRMSTTSGRAIIARRRAKGRWTLCTKSNHNSGKRR